MSTERRSPPTESWTLRVDSLAFGGEGVARKDGKVCFIPGALPGELVEVAPVARRRQYDRMKLLRILAPSPERLLPLCPHTSVCGGCVVQTCRYETQMASKADQVRDCLLRIGGMKAPETGPPLPSPVLVGYRNEMEFTFSSRAWEEEGPPAHPSANPALGLHVPGRFDAVFDLERCVLPSGAFVRALELVRRYARDHGIGAWRGDTDQGDLRHLVLRQGMNTGEILIALVVRRPEERLVPLAEILAREIQGLVGCLQIVNDRPATIARGEREDVLWGRSAFIERLGGLSFEIQAQSFFQTNTWGAEVLIGALRRMVAPLAGGRLCDLYCGAGTMGLCLAGDFDQVVGVEQVSSSVADAVRNARRNRIENAVFVEAQVEDWCSRAAENEQPFQGVLCDPPRAGLHPRALRGVITLAPSWVLYVSCNPSTLARDAALLRDAGYEPAALQICDLFPHTSHVESILLLVRP